MTTYSTLTSQDMNDTNQGYSPASSIPAKKLENRQLWFFFGIAPLAVLAGWSLVAFVLTDNWIWELPMALMFSLIGSLTAMVSTRLR